LGTWMLLLTLESGVAIQAITRIPNAISDKCFMICPPILFKILDLAYSRVGRSSRLRYISNAATPIAVALALANRTLTMVDQAGS